MRRFALKTALDLRAAVLSAALAFGLGGAASACPKPSVTLLFHSCWGDAAAEILLLPEQAAEIPAQARSLTVTGAYTATDTRANGEPKPVGLFLDGGHVINPNLARMDGVLLVTPAGGLSLHHRRDVPLSGRRYDLRDARARQRFAKAAAAQNIEVLQSHLLIIDGVLDIRARTGAPVFARRLLFTDADGFGIYQSAGFKTLHEAAVDLMASFAPQMALNLDMGSFDYCRDALSDTVRNCGVLRLADTAKLSNLLRFTLR